MKKRKVLTNILILTTVSSLAACGSADTHVSDSTNQEITNAPESAPSPSLTNKTEKSLNPTCTPDTLEGILTSIDTDFSNTIQHLTDELKKTEASIGNSYENYVQNKQYLTDWYNLVLEESQTLFTQTDQKSSDYFMLIASSIDHSDFNEVNDAMKDYYDMVYDNLMHNFYDSIYDNAMSEVYDTYYAHIVSDGYETAEYKEWSNESSACYQAWSDTNSAIYKSWSDASSRIYGHWSAVSSGFYNENFDVNDILTTFEKEQAAQTNTDVSSSASPTDPITEEPLGKETSDSSIDSIRPEFKEAMDSYESFFDEYIAFMKKYASADSNDLLSLSDDYANYLTQYAETMSKMQELDNSDLSIEESLYYAKVTTRISQKLLEVQ